VAWVPVAPPAARRVPLLVWPAGARAHALRRGGGAHRHGQGVWRRPSRRRQRERAALPVNPVRLGGGAGRPRPCLGRGLPAPMAARRCASCGCGRSSPPSPSFPIHPTPIVSMCTTFLGCPMQGCSSVYQNQDGVHVLGHPLGKRPHRPGCHAPPIFCLLEYT